MLQSVRRPPRRRATRSPGPLLEPALDLVVRDALPLLDLAFTRGELQSHIESVNYVVQRCVVWQRVDDLPGDVFFHHRGDYIANRGEEMLPGYQGRSCQVFVISLPFF